MPALSTRFGRVTTHSLVLGTVLAFGASNALASSLLNFQVHVTGGTLGDPNLNFNQNGVFVSPTLGYNYSNTNLPHAPPPYGSFAGINDPLGEWSISSWNFNADNDITGPGGAKFNPGFIITNNLPEINGQPALNHLQFSIMVTMAVGPTFGPTSFYGSGGFVLNITPSPDGQTPQWGWLNTVGPNSPIINYMIDGVDVAKLFEGGYQAGGSNGPATASASGNLNNPGNNQVIPLAGMHPTTMGVRLDFDLTPGETVSFNTAFGFIPTPGGLALIGLAGLVTRGRRRR